MKKAEKEEKAYIKELEVCGTDKFAEDEASRLPGSKIANFAISRVTYLRHYKLRRLLIYLYIS